MQNSPNRRTLHLTLLIALMLCLSGAGVSAQAQTSGTAAQTQSAPQLTATPQIPGTSEKFVTVYGAKIHYVEAGSGPVVILLHGLGADWTSWSATIAPLAKSYRVIALDQVGFGASDKPMLPYRVGTLVDFLAGFYKELGIQKASLVGNSLGGWTAAAFAIAHPEKVDRLVLVDAAGVKTGADLKIAQDLNPSTIEGVKKVLSLVLYNKALVNDMTAGMMLTRRVIANDGYTVQQFIASVMRGEDFLEGRLAAIKHPTLIVWGREDLLTPLAMGEQFKKEIPGSQLFVLDKCGHAPQIEKAADFNAALMKFLGNNMASK